MDKLTARNMKAKGWRKLVDLRNKFLLNQIDFMEFLEEIEIILFSYIEKAGIKMAGESTTYAYTTIARRLLKDEIGETESLENLKIDITCYYEHFIDFLDYWNVNLPNHKW